MIRIVTEKPPDTIFNPGQATEISFNKNSCQEERRLFTFTLCSHYRNIIKEMMDTKEEVNAKIMELTMLIQKRHSELSKFLDEMPVTIPNENNPQINITILKDYYESLKKMIEHSSKTLYHHIRALIQYRSLVIEKGNL